MAVLHGGHSLCSPCLDFKVFFVVGGGVFFIFLFFLFRHSLDLRAIVYSALLLCERTVDFLLSQMNLFHINIY